MIHFDQTIDVARNVVREFPLRKNPEGVMGCEYTDKRGNHCLVGQIIVDLGLENILPDHLDNTNYADVAELYAGTAWFDAQAMEFLSKLQRHADKGVSWGKIPVEAHIQNILCPR